MLLGGLVLVWVTTVPKLASLLEIATKFSQLDTSQRLSYSIHPPASGFRCPSRDVATYCI